MRSSRKKGEVSRDMGIGREERKKEIWNGGTKRGEEEEEEEEEEGKSKRGREGARNTFAHKITKEK